MIQYVAKHELMINGRVIRPNTVLKIEDQDLLRALVKKGAVAEVGTGEAVAISIRDSAIPLKGGPSASTSTKKADGGDGPKTGKGEHHPQHLFAFTSEQLDGKSLDDLNAMIIERQPGIEPYTDEKEARAHLMKDTPKS